MLGGGAGATSRRPSGRVKGRRPRGTPDDANRLILYLLEGTDYATGACYRVDGGRFLGVDHVGDA